MKDSKIVLVFGAGFSISSGIPTQDNLLCSVKDYYNNVAFVRKGKQYWIDFLISFQDLFGDEIEKYLIEDLFTIFDKCLLDEESFRGKNANYIRSAYTNLLESVRYYLIEIVNDSISKQKHGYKTYSEFALMLLGKRKKYGLNNDKMSLISLNWDSYFERTLVNKLTNYRKDGLDIDYCTFDNSMDNSGKSTPSIQKHAKNKLNVKYLKPHGSINWGFCSNCGRLYISYGKKIEEKFECIKFCNHIYKEVDLSPVMITPTFLKDISNTHISGIWQNLGIELSEATRIVFIGYSLRPEDYYFRYMLSKYLEAGTEICVFDYVDKKRDVVHRDEKKELIQNKFSAFLQKCIIKEINIDGWENSIKDIENLMP